MDTSKTESVSTRARIQPGTSRAKAGCVKANDLQGRKGQANATTTMVKYARSVGTPLLVGWVILAQSTRWATPWVPWISWPMWCILVTVWVVRVPRPGAIRVILYNPLSPILAAAVVSAVVNGGWWSRVADLALYAVLFALFLDQKPKLDRALVIVGRVVIGICLVEWVYLIRYHGGGRVHLLGNPNVIACALAIVLPLGHGWPWWTLGTLAVLSTGSRAGLLGLGLLVASKLPKWVGFVALVLAGLLLAIARPVGTWYRIAFFSQAIKLFVDHPIFGVGPGLYRYREWMHAHNIVLTWLAETGIVGLLGMAVSILLVTKTYPRSLGAPVDLSPILIVAPFFLVDDQVMFWFSALGALYLLAKSVNQGQNDLAFCPPRRYYI